MNAESDTEKLRAANDAIHQLRQTDDPPALAAALQKLAYLERRLKMYEAAAQHYGEAAAIWREQRVPLRVAHTVRHVGDVHRDAGHNDLAEPCYREALELYRSSPDAPPLDVANAIRSAALLAGVTGDKGRARQLWQEARSLYLAGQIQEGVAECDRWLAALKDND